MKILFSGRGLFALGFAVLVLTNIAVFSGVASNRSGEPESQVTLTERELQLPYRIHQENSGFALRLSWRALGKDDTLNKYPDWRSPLWFNAEKLEALGFNVNDYQETNGKTIFYKQPIPKEVFIALEYNGESYQEALKRAQRVLEREEGLFTQTPGDKRLREQFERAQKRVTHEQMTESRLFAIDAGLDPKALREKYSDRTRFVIAKGLVKPRYNYNKNKKEVVGYITRLSVQTIHVALEHRQMLEDIIDQDKAKRDEFEPARYEVELAYGNRWEPWIVAIRHMDNESK